ncbi:MAG: V-type ATP synthase subunit E [Planctomycetota bacterium]|jgi:vacuolar-type H+-ATPase subunit E/Vma4
MESVEKEKAALISGIETDARAEEQEIIKEAENKAAEKRKYSEKKIESLLNDARKKAEEQAEAVRRKIISSVELEVKRRSMHVQDSVIQEIMHKVEKKLNSKTTDTNYRSVLIDWISEAAVGLDVESAQINASEKERKMIDEQLLSEVTGKIHTQTGRQVALTMSDEQPLKSQGVVLTAGDESTAFNNQVKTRMLRNKREILTLIYNTLFTDNRKK